MRIYALPEQLQTVPAARRVIAVGMFDGIHIGHRAVLTTALLEDTLTPAVFTFSYAHTPKAGAALQTADARRQMLADMEFEELFEADFDALRTLSPAAFADLLHDSLHAQAVVCGSDFHFGRDGAGDIVLLRQLCLERGMTLHVTPPVLADAAAVSSTAIKAAIAAGDMAIAARLLGRPVTVTTTVVSGQHLGRTLGSPTINQPLSAETILPRFGVYASLAIVDGRSIPAVTNIGMRPTVGSTQPLAETYILDFDGDLYGQSIPVQLIRFLRPETKFSSLDRLKAQIKTDAQTVHRFFAPEDTGSVQALLFDFDDTLTRRDASFENCCRTWLARQFPQADHRRRADAAYRLCACGDHGYLPMDQEVMQSVYRELGGDPEAMIQAFWKFIKIGCPQGIEIPCDVPPTLLALRQKGYRLGIVTNGNAIIQSRKLDVSGLRPLFDTVLICGEEDVQKPDAEIFRRAAQRLGVAPEQCAFIGDNVKNDVIGSQMAGMRPIFVDHQYEGYTVTDPDIVHISTLPDLLQIF